ncbi:LPXTG cell wall anchor domain-containing protein [Streptomyces sp. TRM43335]|uniref:LPXTG cell wall anchor domain-containing protein n=1 Tax=Streptomyces taklimakanensis TaxID=2569853 RepID=A0A6G2BBQ8_9ACTN|nr:LPXTG cell wall anchor domain-containing protein [Streptomyces taklimakanensis]MTE19690.1 LPXTG cell wall anchor domain-containing protein [Streptomyces taklimakanensis]
MPIVNRSTARLLGAGAVALLLSAGGATTAVAHSGGDGWGGGKSSDFRPGEGAGSKSAADNCEFSLDGETWHSSVKLDTVRLKPAADGTVHLSVRTAREAGSCTASLAAYRTHGPTWETSGAQVFHDFDTVSLGRGEVDTLDIAVPDEGCYAQLDLYRGNTRFDGGTGEGHGPLPIGPDRPVIKDKLIAAWNGGTRECLDETPAPTPSEPSEPAGTPSETPPESGEPTPPASEAPTGTPTEASTESAPPSGPEETAPGGESPQAPEASESAVPSAGSETGSSSGTGGLAETGSGTVGPVAAGAAALLLAGGGVLYSLRRRRAVGN